MALHRFHLRAPGSVSHLIANFRKRLCDNDPGVMGAIIYPLFDLIMADVDSFKDMVVSFVNILEQITERKLPKSCDYHQKPALFIQSLAVPIKELGGARRVANNGDKAVGIAKKADRGRGRTHAVRRRKDGGVEGEEMTSL
ncbi:AP-4 complex subunit epsilon-like [Primulina tabacum]|uniref:AP-4 complex subunit epsilon-like n=1 Tax=Primulina tabacum TaxID=48773 RepID=UPI003F5AC857